MDSQSNGVIAQRNAINRRFYTQLPDLLPSRINTLASEITRGGRDDRARVEFMENYFSFAIRRPSIFHTREERVLSRFLKFVEREFSISTGEGGVGLFEIALLVDNSHVSSFVEIYAGAVYHDRRLTDDEYLRLKQILRGLKSHGSKIS